MPSPANGTLPKNSGSCIDLGVLRHVYYKEKTCSGWFFYYTVYLFSKINSYNYWSLTRFSIKLNSDLTDIGYRPYFCSLRPLQWSNPRVSTCNCSPGILGCQLAGCHTYLDGRCLLRFLYSLIKSTFSFISYIYLFGRGPSSFLKNQRWKLREDCKTLGTAENATWKIFE